MSPSPVPSRASLPLALLVWGALAIALNVGLARFTYGVMLPSIRRDLGLDYLGSGNLNAIHLAGYLIGTLSSPWVLKRTGAIRLACGAHLVVALAAAACALAPATAVAGPLVLGAGRFLTGLGAGGGIVGMLVIVFGAVAPDRRMQASAAVWAGMGLAIIGSGLAVPWLLGPAVGWRCAFAVSAVLALAVAFSFPPAGTPVPAPAPEARAGAFAARRLLSMEWAFLLGTYLLFGIAYVAYATFAGAQLASLQAPPALVTGTWVCLGLMSIVGAALTPTVIASARLRQYALAVALAMGAAGAAVVSLHQPLASVVGALLVGLGLAATPSIVTAYVRERCSADQYPRAFSFATAALGIGQLVGPIAGGALADRFGTVAIPVFAAAAYGLGALLATADALAARGASQPVAA